MSNINDFINDLRDAITELPTDTLTGFVEFAHDANDAIKRRVIETGFNARGVSLQAIKDYGEAYKRKKSGLTKKKIERANKRLQSDLEKDRAVSPKTLDKAIGIGGRYRGFVDLTFSGRLWNNIQVLPPNSSADMSQVKVSIGALGEDNRKILEGNVRGNGKWKGRGEVLELSESELPPLQLALQTNIANRFISHFR